MSAVLYPGGVPQHEAPIALQRNALERSLEPVPSSRGAGIAVVVAVHLVVGWALASGLARDALSLIKRPIEMAIIPEVAPPPPPPPPKIEKPREIPKVQAPPPPAYVPPPEITPPPVPAPAPVIQAVQPEPPPAPVVIAPPPPPVVAAPAPPPPPVVVKKEISLACPGYQAVLAEMLEEAMDRVGVVGTVSTRILVRGNQVVDAAVLSGPKEYAKYVQAAIKRMRCSAGGADEVQVALSINFSR